MKTAYKPTSNDTLTAIARTVPKHATADQILAAFMVADTLPDINFDGQAELRPREYYVQPIRIATWTGDKF